jgi:DNA processing protein
VNIPWRSIPKGHAEYPRRLYALEDAPQVLYVSGRLPATGVAIIGSRYADEEACRFAFALARSLGAPVISGLARGVDAAAHRGALAARVPTLAYLGTGIDRTFPPEHDELALAIVAAGGALATEQPPGTEATEATLRARDRLQAAHSAAIVLVTTEIDGGAMHTMRFARELGRPRFACASRGPADAGNRLAVSDGAIELPWEIGAARERITQGLALCSNQWPIR